MYKQKAHSALIFSGLALSTAAIGSEIAPAPVFGGVDMTTKRSVPVPPPDPHVAPKAASGDVATSSIIAPPLAPDETADPTIIAPPPPCPPAVCPPKATGTNPEPTVVEKPLMPPPSFQSMVGGMSASERLELDAKKPPPPKAAPKTAAA